MPAARKRQNYQEVNPSRVVSLIQARKQALIEHGHVPADGHKLGLVIEGGGMRSSYSAGGAFALAEMGLADVFDEVYATSAGVMNASYLLSNQPKVGITVYYDSCTSPLFLNPWRLWKVLNIDYLFDQVVRSEKWLDVDALRRAKPDFFAAVIDCAQRKGRMIDVNRYGGDVVEVLKAATAMPVFYNRTVEVEGHPCMDAGLSIPFPLPQAMAAGCTDILVLLSRHRGYQHQAPTWSTRKLFNLICARGETWLEHVYAQHHLVANASRDLAFGRSGLEAKVNIATLCPPYPERIGRMTADPMSLFLAATEYAKMTMRVFGQTDESCSLPFPMKARGRTKNAQGAR